MAELIVIPELIKDALFLHIRGELLLLDAGAAALKVENVRIALLGVFVVLGALALKLKLAGGYIGDLRSYGGRALVYRGELPLLFRTLGAQLLYAPLMCAGKRAARLAVAGEALQQRPELPAGAFRSALLRLE